MKKSRITFGPGAASLILIVVILSLSVLGLLALMNARNDIRLTQRGTQVIEAVYALNEAAERSVANLDAVLLACGGLADSDEAYLLTVRNNLPAGMMLNGRLITWTETDGYRTLDCAVEVAPLGEDARLQWRTHRLTAVTEGAWN